MKFELCHEIEKVLGFVKDGDLRRAYAQMVDGSYGVWKVCEDQELEQALEVYDSDYYIRGGSCNCRGHQMRGHCRHMRELKACRDRQ